MASKLNFVRWRNLRGIEKKMEVEELYHRLLNLKPAWNVKTVVIHNEADKVEVHLEHRATERLGCQVCGDAVKVSGFGATKTWRHLDTCRMRTYLHAALPILACPKHGKLALHAPWAGEVSGYTLAFEKRCTRLAKEFGGVKAASRITGVGPGDVRSMLRAEQLLDRASINTASETPTEVSGKHEQQPQIRQLSLFAQKDMPLINEGLQALKKLDLDKAIELFQRHKSLFPKGYDVASKIAIAEFLREGFRTAPAEDRDRLAHLCILWRALEDHPASIGATQELSVQNIKPAFFEKILREAERFGLADIPFVSDDIPMGYLFLQTGQLEHAIQSLQACILKDPDNAAVYGYLGDAYLLRGDKKTARQSYREACLIDPAGMDWRHLKDEELKEFKEELLLEYGFDQQLTVEWLPSHARIDGLFERKVIGLHAGVKEMVNEYLALRKSLSRKQNPLVQARLFLRGLILCENEESFKLVKKIDLMDVRREMRQVNPDLFEEFLDKIIAGSVA